MSRAHVIACGLLLCVGCAGTDSFRLNVRTPDDVSLAGAPEIERGSSATIRSGRVSTGETTSAGYALTAERDPDGSLSLNWSTRLALVAGDRDRIVGPGGFVPVREEDARRVEASDAGPIVRVPACAWLDSRSDEAGMLIGYAAGHAPTCAYESLRVPLVIETPSSNVTSITRHHAGASEIAALGFMLTTIVFGSVGLPFVLVPPLRTAGYVVLAVGGALDLMMLPGLLDRDHDDVVWQR